ncbi:MAG: T9SS type A sorting domain-containing protein [Bacteroidota bacterium]
MSIRFVLIFLACLFVPLITIGQSLSSTRVTDWTLAGLSENRIDPPLILDFLEEGGSNDGMTPNDSIFQKVLTQYASTPFLLQFPIGTYLFRQAIDLPDNIILRGSGADSTLLLFDLEDPAHLIQIRGQVGMDTVYLKQTAHKDEKYLQVQGSHPLQAGEYINLFEADDSLITSSWAQYSTGQLVRIREIEADTLWLDQPLRRDFSIRHAARVVSFHPRTQVGIEQLGIQRLDQTTSQTSNILFEYAANSWLSCIRSERCNFAHAEIKHSTQIEISGSHFEKAFSYGGGGKAYGVMLHFASGNCLIRDNSFRSLRHAMILQAGANGNVLAYNYSTNPYWTGVSLPANSAGDLVLHGNYPYANLLEGNVVQNIVIDNSHGINGPHNTFYRNRAELYGLFMNSDPASNGQNFLGNEIPNPQFLFGNYVLAGSDHLEIANNVRGVLTPANQEVLPENSLFVNQAPNLFDGQLNIPLIGHPNLLNTHTIQAQDRFDANHSTACDVPDPVLASHAQSDLEDINAQLYPNPAKNRIEIEIKESPTVRLDHVEVLGIDGSLLLSSKGSLLDIGHLPTGMYLVKITIQDGRFWTEKLLKE